MKLCFSSAACYQKTDSQQTTTDSHKFSEIAISWDALGCHTNACRELLSHVVSIISVIFISTGHDTVLGYIQ